MTATHASEDPVETARLHAVGLAALASLLADERVSGPQRGGDVDRARADALELLPGDVDGLLASVWERRGAVSNAVRSGLGQIARAAEGQGAWEQQSDEVLLAQGRASANLGRIFGEIAAAHPHLQQRLAGGGAILDVGTGVGALACALAETFPQAQVVGIDIAERPLQLASRELAARPELAERVTLRQADIAELGDRAAFDLIWLPSPFLTPDVLGQAYRVCRRALTDAGRLVVGLNGEFTSDRQRASRRWLAELAGRVDETPGDSRHALTELGFGAADLRPTVPGGPWLLDAGVTTPAV